MTFENFSRLTNSTLLNTPSISSFEKIEIDAKKVKRGDLFIGDSKEDIELALSNDAYAIVSTLELEILDEEIAWFYTDSLDEVLIKLLRFTLLQRDFEFIHAPDLEYELIKKITDRYQLIFLDADEKKSYKKIINASEKTIFISTNREFLKKIYPEHKTIQVIKKDILKNIKNTIFLSSFTYRDRVYNNIKIPAIFLKNLKNILYFLDENSIEYDIEKLTFTKHFYPLFINKNLQLRGFGKTQHVIICESDEELIEKELNYLKKEATWAKITPFEISDLDDLLKLKNIEFNFAIIFANYDKLIEILEKNEKKRQIELF